MTQFGPFLRANGDDVLEFDGVTVTALAEQFGTPLFVLSENTIRANFRRIRDAFQNVYPAEVIVCAGMKGNWGLAARRVMVEEGGGGDAFGLGELTVAMMAGSDPRKIVMNGANKSRETIEAAIDMGVLNQVDNIDELRLVGEVAAALGKTARISLRIRLPLSKLAEVNYVDARYPEGISPSYWERTFKFGLEPETYVTAVEIAKTMPNVSLEGMHYHGGIPAPRGLLPRGNRGHGRTNRHDQGAHRLVAGISECRRRLRDRTVRCRCPPADGRICPRHLRRDHRDLQET